VSGQFLAKTSFRPWYPKQYVSSILVS
jgi:hypothetical protein